MQARQKNIRVKIVKFSQYPCIACNEKLAQGYLKYWCVNPNCPLCNIAYESMEPVKEPSPR